jgi:hypothetical protein
MSNIMFNFVVMKNVYHLEIPYTNDIDKLKKSLMWYFMAINMVKDTITIRQRLIEVLAYYVHMGYNDETKKLILDSIPGMKRTNLNQINSDLQKMGCLVKDRMRDTIRYLHPNLIKLKEYTEKDEFPIYAIKLLKQ